MSFRFKQFSINHDKCAMKVGTDGVLLGAWSSLSHNPNSILDIGAGSGVVSLMLAQRSGAEVVDAIEVDEDAYEQCVSNYENSPWADRLFCYHAYFQEFVAEMGDESYDLIVSNPPFFQTEKTISETSRELARFTTELPFSDLLHGVSVLLSDSGVFCVVIPFEVEQEFIKLAKEFKLYPKCITRVKGTNLVGVKRSLIQFSSDLNNQVKEEELVLEVERHVYTPEYTDLVQDFYLKL